MRVSEALESRISCRAFLDRPVSPDTLRDLIDRARKAPSGGNLQPWHVYVLSGTSLSRLRALLAQCAATNPAGDGLEYDIYPKGLAEPYRSRRSRCAEALYSLLGIARSDHEARYKQLLRNMSFYGAPVGLFFAVDRQMGPPQWGDTGMFAQSIMLLAREYGLDTCPQEYWAMWHRTVARYVRMPDRLMLWFGMALGYRDPDAAVNQLAIARAPLHEIATFLES